MRGISQYILWMRVHFFVVPNRSMFGIERQGPSISGSRMTVVGTLPQTRQMQKNAMATALN